MSVFEPAVNTRRGNLIKVIGVGGGGSNAVNHMFRHGIEGVDFYICNTDLQALHSSPIPNRLQLGAQLTEGLGAGSMPDMGEKAAMENMQQIRQIMEDNTKMIFICSPNNPTGNSLNRTDIETILANFKGLVVIDEAYINFAKQKTFIQELTEYANLVILQTFSKAWGLASAASMVSETASSAHASLRSCRRANL